MLSLPLPLPYRISSWAEKDGKVCEVVARTQNRSIVKFNSLTTRITPERAINQTAPINE